MTFEIAISQTDFPDIETETSVFETADIGVDVTAGSAKSEAELIDLASDADGLIVQYAQVTESVLSELPNLSVVSRYGIGVDNIDIEAASEHGVAVTHVPSYCEEEVATHAFSLLLTLARRTAQYDSEVKSSTWDWKNGRPIESLTGKTVGFVAFGKIPRRFADLAAGFNFEYVTYDPYLSEDDIVDHPVEKVDFDTLLSESDIISIHTPLVEETCHMFDDNAFAQMKDSAFLLNTSRGPIIDETALNKALVEDEIAGAGLDVMEEEPTHESPLFEHDDLVVTPHVAWYSEASLTELRRKAAENIVNVIQGDQPHGFANHEQVSL
ncbi:C-terminal binding protein [Haloarcula nitratireducens]|uniref:C-terminal binding protein n=1 Tax=Haloarcula nitratireducens TaxID=2487749 RepID=A0AAW4PH32_9EURY|nr:C-terminal binding protein [Halomicroarcula nitratireducens]MBX0297052.1 C-terminal binding protein [Halomicroarcula nitratireducens]